MIIQRISNPLTHTCTATPLRSLRSPSLQAVAVNGLALQYAAQSTLMDRELVLEVEIYSWWCLVMSGDTTGNIWLYDYSGEASIFMRPFVRVWVGDEKTAVEGFSSFFFEVSHLVKMSAPQRRRGSQKYLARAGTCSAKFVRGSSCSARGARAVELWS